MSKEIKRMVSAICYALDLKEKEVCSPSRKEELVDARFIAVYFIKKYFPFTTYTEIAALFGRTHCFCVYAVNQVELFNKVDLNFIKKFNKVENYLELDLFHFSSIPQF